MLPGPKTKARFRFEPTNQKELKMNDIDKKPSEQAQAIEKQAQMHAIKAQEYIAIATDAEANAEKCQHEALRAAFEAGHHLLAAKKLIPHGRWESWLRTNFPASVQTARSYMRLAAQEHGPYHDQLNSTRSIREALKMVAQCEDEPDQYNAFLDYYLVVGLDRLPRKVAMRRASQRLQAWVRDVFFATLPDDVTLFFGLGPGRVIWDQVVEQCAEPFFRELEGRASTQFHEWKQAGLKKKTAIRNRLYPSRIRERLDPNAQQAEKEKHLALRAQEGDEDDREQWRSIEQTYLTPRPRVRLQNGAA
jgi:hypothetical protein